ncbi:MAG TPA: calcium/sodium antiporter [Roseococcus sp.]|jgi:cation:H+ antiporter|nr:calcium/sodium antiporter [Roseococcus sp.]
MEIALWLLGGLVLLVLGGELLVRGAVQIAARLGISPLLVGLTVVAFGTSTPELVTSVQASLAGSPGIALGNIVGSNIANVLLILGVSALICPIAVNSRALARDGGLGFLAALALLAVGLFWTLDRAMGVLLLLALVGYIVFAYQQERVTEGADHGAAYDKAEAFAAAHPPAFSLSRALGGLPGSILLLVAGLGLIVTGGSVLVDAAVTLARAWSVSEEVIGLTIIAVGTSLPELVTSVVAAVRRQADVALGNVLGSNIYNILGIAGATALIAPTDVPASIATFDTPIMVAASLLVLVVARTGWRVGRREGGVLLACYVAYVWSAWPA